MMISMDPTTQKAVQKERDLINGSGSMSTSLRGSNTSLNSMFGVVPSMCFNININMFVFWFVFFFIL